MPRRSRAPHDPAPWATAAPVRVVLALQADGLFSDLGRLETSVVGVNGDQVVVLTRHGSCETTRAGWLAQQVEHWQQWGLVLGSEHLLLGALPDAVALNSQQWAAVHRGDRADRVDRLVPVAESSPALRVRDRGAPWRTCNASEALLVLAALPVAILATLTVAVEASGPHRSRQQVTWLLCRDGWREVADGAPGIRRLVRRDPSVLASRIGACLPRVPGATS